MLTVQDAKRLIEQDLINRAFIDHDKQLVQASISQKATECDYRGDKSEMNITSSKTLKTHERGK